MLEFKPINLTKHRDQCVEFRADSFVCSFGSADLFYEMDGDGVATYLHWLEQKMKTLPHSCVHVWHENQIIGQIEMGRWKQDFRVGHVNLFYLTPEFRGQGLGQQLEQHAATFLQELGCRSARLSVSPTNLLAVRFYLKHGWVDLGQRQDAPEVHWFEKSYS